jgi:16S rRNA (cytidine1402-2'-O)-methyltransferase
MSGKIYLIPTLIGDSVYHEVLPERIKNVIKKLDYFIVENERSARRFISWLDMGKNIDDITFYILNKRTVRSEVENFLHVVFKGNDIGILSEAGVPCIADPGAMVVEKAHMSNIQVVPMVGPSSILLALMASGLNGQQFSFVGYIPVKKNERVKRIKQLEYISKKHHQTQLFIETPYRNMAVFEDLIKHCHGNTSLCIACELTTPREYIRTLTISEWKAVKPDIHKKAAIFLLEASVV